jgi:hypothetical protein
MIDHDARTVAAEALQQFADGLLTNKEYEDRYPNSTVDPALREVRLQVWFLYSDVKTHTLTGKHGLSDENRIFVQRCILFLKSDCEFQWPRQRLRLWYPILCLLGFGRVLKRRDGEAYKRCGDEAFWPFTNKAQYEQALGADYLTCARASRLLAQGRNTRNGWNTGGGVP